MRRILTVLTLLAQALMSQATTMSHAATSQTTMSQPTVTQATMSLASLPWVHSQEKVTVEKVTVTVRGRVTRSDSGAPVENANVMLCRSDGRSVYRFAMTSSDGTYSIEYSGDDDSLAVRVTGFNLRAQTRVIPARSMTVDFSMEWAAMSLGEVTVRAEPVERRMDTVVYHVESFRESGDRTIGEVMSRMPGIEVSRSGRLRYNGKDIGRMYVEGLDMLESRYGLATNTIRAEDIASVEVMEDHQHIKIYEDQGLPGAPAVNLRLKKGARGTWGGYIAAGGGYRPAMWYGEAAAMYFGRRFQTMDTYKTNNTGDDVSEEIFGGLMGFSDGASSVLGVKRPSVPPFGKNRYLDNQTHMVSANSIVRLRGDLNLRANVQYQHDLREDEGTSVTTYHLADPAQQIVIGESILSRSRLDRLTADIDVESNTKERYITDKLSFSGSWSTDYGGVDNNGSSVEQSFRHPGLSLSNRFRYMRSSGPLMWDASSDVSYSDRPETLTVRPLIYDGIFGDGAGADGAVQSISARRLTAYNRAGLTFNRSGWFVSLTFRADAAVDMMRSELSPLTTDGPPPQAADSMRNDILRQEYTVAAQPSVSYRIGKKFNISAYASLGYKGIRQSDRVRGSTGSIDRPLVSPALSMQLAITPELRLSASASYDESYGGLYSDYGGYIMSNYRHISRTGGELPRRRLQNYVADLSYAATRIAAFAKLSGGYWRSWNSHTYGTVYDGTLTRVETVDSPGLSHGVNVAANASKLFFAISTTVKLSASWSRTWSSLYRQYELYQSEMDNISGTLALSSRFCDWAGLDYGVSASRSRSVTDIGGEQPPIHSLRQNAALSLSFAESVFLKVGGEHYYNDAVSGDRSMFFLDASLSWRTKRLELTLECRNLLGTDTYSSAVYSDITTYVYTYRLRPLAALLKIRFTL